MKRMADHCPAQPNPGNAFVIDLDKALARWRQAGLIDEPSEAAIRDFEGRQLGPTPAMAPRGRVFSSSEIVAYIGSIMGVVGIGFLIGSQGRVLGATGRTAIFAVVAMIAMIMGFGAARISSKAPALRARSSALALGSIASGLLIVELIHDHLPHFTSGPLSAPIAPIEITMGALSVALLALAFLLVTRSGLLAGLVVLATCLAAGASLDWIRPQQDWQVELVWLVAGAVLLSLAELFGRRTGPSGRELLRFVGLLAPTWSALAISSGLIGASQGVHGFEALAIGLGLAGFAASVPRSSAGYAIAGGLALFSSVVDIGARYFGSSLGFGLVLIICGVVLLAIGLALSRFVPWLLKRPIQA